MINKSFLKKNWIIYPLFLLGFFLIVYHGRLLIHRPIQTTIPYKEYTNNKHAPLRTSTMLKEGDLIGNIILPTLHKSMNIYQGTNQKILDKGIGHYLESSMPGDHNNTVLSGHRDTFFRALKDIKPKDFILIKTNKGTFYYKVRKIDIVTSNNHQVLTVKSRPILTLTTCYPFYYIGNAPKRYIVTSDLIKSETN
ncbi:sortase [Niallia sp. 03133]|uniref:sortase n=1 Tax=Niallia sp. 03133 TaxID=3458060 RepID=UPI004044FC74